MLGILNSLKSHKDDIKESDYAKFQSAKTLGQKPSTPHAKTVIEPDPEMIEEEEEVASKPEISKETRERF